MSRKRRVRLRYARGPIWGLRCQADGQNLTPPELERVFCEGCPPRGARNFFMLMSTRTCVAAAVIDGKSFTRSIAEREPYARAKSGIPSL
jgi:hypothetical protein